MFTPIASRLFRLRERLTVLLGQGLDPASLALTLALGLTIGIMPSPWGASLICAFLASVCGCNQGLIQLVNYAVWPLQIMLYVPFLRLGQTVFGIGNLPVDFRVVAAGLQNDAVATLSGLGSATLKAIGAWALLAPFLIIGLQGLFVRILRRRRRTGP